MEMKELAADWKKCLVSGGRDEHPGGGGAVGPQGESDHLFQRGSQGNLLLHILKYTALCW